MDSMTGVARGAADALWAAGSRRNRSQPDIAMHKVLMTGDGIALFVGFAVPLIVLAERGAGSFGGTLLSVAIVTAVGVWAVRFQDLWLDRVAAVRSIEASKIFRALAIACGIALVLDRKSHVNLRVPGVLAAAVIGWVVFVLWRSAYRAFVTAERKRGRMLKHVIIVGANRRAAEVYRLIHVHSELGMRVVALVGDRHEATRIGLGHVWKAEYDEASAVLAGLDAEVVIMCSGDIDQALAASLTRDQHASRRTVFVDPGMSGFDIRRFQPTHLAHQPLLEVESMSLGILQLAVKRAFDIVVATIVAVLFAPALVVIAALIKLDDRGPVFFRQTRIGRHGEPFGILKFRTMVVDAEARLAALRADNERHGGLFKMDNDPRVTRIGRFLRATSLDELPQLFNVLLGTMSLVGPRPALPHEVAEFPEALMARHDVRPGITGLWQVEARDNPHFDAYQRLDLFYVENWSLVLDMVIMLGTFDHLAFRPLIKWRYRREPDLTTAAPANATANAA